VNSSAQFCEARSAAPPGGRGHAFAFDMSLKAACLYCSFGEANYAVAAANAIAESEELDGGLARIDLSVRN
jgi:hypothetical protein